MPAVVQGGRYGYGKYHPGYGSYGGWYGPWNAKEVDTGEFEEDPAKNSILLYDLDNAEDIEELEAEIQKTCQCKIEHLPAIQSFILHYENSAHLPASTFSSLPGIIFSNEDEVIMPPDEEDRDRRGLMGEIEMACNEDCWKTYRVGVRICIFQISNTNIDHKTLFQTDRDQTAYYYCKFHCWYTAWMEDLYNTHKPDTGHKTK